MIILCLEIMGTWYITNATIAKPLFSNNNTLYWYFAGDSYPDRLQVAHLAVVSQEYCSTFYLPPHHIINIDSKKICLHENGTDVCDVCSTLFFLFSNSKVVETEPFISYLKSETEVAMDKKQKIVWTKNISYNNYWQLLSKFLWKHCSFKRIS